MSTPDPQTPRDYEHDIATPTLVTFRRRRSGGIHRCGFNCGDSNGLLILQEAWNSGSEIVAVEPLHREAQR